MNVVVAVAWGELGQITQLAEHVTHRGMQPNISRLPTQLLFDVVRGADISRAGLPAKLEQAYEHGQPVHMDVLIDLAGVKSGDAVVRRVDSCVLGPGAGRWHLWIHDHESVDVVRGGSRLMPTVATAVEAAPSSAAGQYRENTA